MPTFVQKDSNVFLVVHQLRPASLTGLANQQSTWYCEPPSLRHRNQMLPIILTCTITDTSGNISYQMNHQSHQPVVLQPLTPPVTMDQQLADLLLLSKVRAVNTTVLDIEPEHVAYWK